MAQPIAPERHNLLLTGPAGSGKSTAARGWAERSARPRARIDPDELRVLIHAGRADPERGWDSETQRQWDLAMDLWRAMAAIYRSYAVDYVVDLYAPPVNDPRWQQQLGELGLRQVVLLPGLEICLERNRRRGRRPFLADADLRRNYADFAECVRNAEPTHVIDNGGLGIEETVDAIEDALRPSDPSSCR